MNAILIFQFLFKDTKPVGTKTKRKKGKKKGKERTINRRSLSHNVILLVYTARRTHSVQYLVILILLLRYSKIFHA